MSNCKGVLIKNDFPNKTGKARGYIEDKSHNVGVYCWTNKINGKKYVGQATDLKKRKRQFLNFNEWKYSGVYINNARQKYNVSDFWNYEILEYCTKFQLNKFETYNIKFLNSNNSEYGYNLTEGGEGTIGYSPTEETRKKLSEAFTGENNPFYGKHHTEEIKKKLSEIRVGKYCGEKNGFFGKHHTEETKLRWRKDRKGKRTGEDNPNYGKHHSEETLKKMSENRKGKLKGENHPFFGTHFTEEPRKNLSISKKGKYTGANNPNYGKHHTDEVKEIIRKARSKPIIQYDMNMNYIREWDSAKIASEELGYSHSNLCIHLKKDLTDNYKGYKGFIWRYKNLPS